MRQQVESRFRLRGKKSWLILPIFFIFFCGLTFESYAVGINAEPVAKQLSENGKEIVGTDNTIIPGGEFLGAAPMEVEFTSNVSSSTANLRYEWKVSDKSDFSTTLLSRFDQNMKYTFTASGKWFIKLYITDTNTKETFESDFFTIVISESELKVPNAFSPNGDGVNDIFIVKHKSLVKFNAVVFNRWGQELYRWNNPDIGWDGTSHGKNVNDGVYFIAIEAVGSDGIKYNHKGDINILRGTNGDTPSSTP